MLRLDEASRSEETGAAWHIATPDGGGTAEAGSVCPIKSGLRRICGLAVRTNTSVPAT